MKKILFLCFLLPQFLFALSFELKNVPNEKYLAVDLNGQIISPYKSVKNSCHIQLSETINHSDDPIFQATYFKSHVEKDALLSKGFSQIRFEGINSSGQQILIICRAQDRILNFENLNKLLSGVGLLR